MLTLRALAAAIAVATIALAVGGAPAASDAASINLRLPTAGGSEWEIIAGYNTYTHNMSDGGDPYAVDIVRRDAATEFSDVLAPVDGTISWVGSDCLTIRDANDSKILMCHVLADSGLRSGDVVSQGDHVAVVAPAGQAGNNGLPHIHLAVHAGSGRWEMTTTLPLTGQYALEGRDLAPTTTFNAYYGVRFISTNGTGASSNAPPSVSAGADRVVRPGDEVSITASGSDPDDDPLTYMWDQTGGAPLGFVTSGPTVTFTAPGTDGAEVTFSVAAIDPGNLIGTDDVRVTVDSNAPAPAPEPSSTAPPAPTPLPDGNTPPQPDAGPDLWLDPGETRTVTGRATDADNDLVVLAWTKTSGGLIGYIANSNWLTIGARPDSEGVFEFTLSAMDSKGAASTDTLRVYVGDVSALPEPTPTPEPTPEPTPTPSPTPEPTVEPTPGATPEPTPVPAPEPAGSGGEPTVTLGDDRSVAAGSTVTLKAVGEDPEGKPLQYTWDQSAGPAVAYESDGALLTFVAPDEVGVTLTFTVAAIDSTSSFAVDSVDVTVVEKAPPPEPEPEPEAKPEPAPDGGGDKGSGTITNGELPADGVGALVFGGGSSDQLVSAAGCPIEYSRFWVVHDGSFVVYIPAAFAFVNAEWNALFSGGIPAGTIILGSCAK